jgi:hypothetical protein
VSVLWPVSEYIVDILERASMADCKPCTTLVDTQGKAFDDDDPNYSQYKYISQPWLGLGFHSSTIWTTESHPYSHLDAMAQSGRCRDLGVVATMTIGGAIAEADG